MQSKISPTEFYDKFASTYDDTAKSPQCDARIHSEAVKIFNKHNSCVGGRVLDIGCGTGILKTFLQGEFEFTGIDVSAKMLDRASWRGYKIIHKSVENALEEIPDRSFDFVFALSSLQFVKSIDEIMAKIDRIARRGFLLSIDNLTEEFIKKSKMNCYNHSQISIPNTT